MISSNAILDPQQLRERVKYFLDQPRFVMDLETVPPPGAHDDYRGIPQVNRVAWMSFATHGDAFTLPLGHPNGNRMIEKARRKKDPETKKFIVYPARWEAPPEQMKPAQAFEILYPLLFSKSIAKGGHGFLFDVLSSMKYYDGETIPGPFHDSIISTWLINENQRLGLKDLTTKRYKHEYDNEHVGRRVENYSFNKVHQYAFLDARFSWLHQENNLAQIAEENLQEVYGLEMEIFETLVEMGSDGVPVDVDKMRELEPVLSRRREQCIGEMYKKAGKKFNVNSNPQKVNILYGSKEDGNQGLKPWKLTKGGLIKADKGQDLKLADYSTDAEALETHKKNPVVAALLDYQEVDRVLGTYIHGYLGVPDDPKKPCIIFDGKVYPEFVQYGTVTGRFSCRTPNLQNIPRAESELGKMLRSMFVAGPGHKLIVADYGQIELVVLAHFAGKGALWDGFLRGIDPHTMTAAVVFGVTPEEVTKEQRQAAKAINFAVVYGAGPAKVASMAGVSERRAKQILATHEREFPEIYKFKDRALHACRSRKPPHLTTLKGRKRRVPSIMSRDFKVAGRAERQAINSLIQGSAADLIKVAMVRLQKALAESDTGGRLILTVHDELVVRVPDEHAEQCAKIVLEAMTGDGIQSMVDVPLSVSMNIGDNWEEAK